MSIKSQGGVFGRNPTFATLTVENGISVGSLTVGGETITGLSYQGAWNANTNTPDITASPAQGQFWIVSVDGSTNVGGITNWTTGDWALYDGSSWQRVEGGNTDLSSGVTGQLAVTNGGTGASDAATARTNLGLGSAATTASTDYATAAQGSLADSALQPGDIGSTVQGYDADTAKYDDTTANFTGTLQNGGSNVLVDSDIGSTVQGYDADTAKLDTAQTFTAAQTFSSGGSFNELAIGTSTPDRLLLVQAGQTACIKVKNTLNNSPTYNHIELYNNNETGYFKVVVGRSGIGGPSTITTSAGLTINTNGNGVNISSGVVYNETASGTIAASATVDILPPVGAGVFYITTFCTTLGYGSCYGSGTFGRNSGESYVTADGLAEFDAAFSHLTISSNAPYIRIVNNHPSRAHSYTIYYVGIM